MDTEMFDRWSQIGVAVAALLSGAWFVIKKMLPYIRRKRAAKSEELFNQINMRIWEVLSELRIKTKASRVSLTQFHNGGKFSNGASMRKMSITHQTCENKVPSTMQFRQDVLVSRYVEIVQMLQDNDSNRRMVSSLYDCNSKKFYELHDTLSFSMLPVYCNDSLLVNGYISIEWCDFGTIDNLDDKMVESLFETARDQVAYLVHSLKEYR